MAKILTSNIMNGISSAVSSYFTLAESNDILLQEKEILKIGNVLNSIFINRNDIDIPRIVVVGSQSSGKSSVLNSILGMDILPTGANMVTRTPLQLELIQSKNETKASFGEYIDSDFVVVKEVDISFPNPTSEQKHSISSTIKDITNRLAGDNMNISTIPIYLRIYSPHIPNLSLVDLPGLTMVACTDQGQPKDIKNMIKDLIKSYISHKSTIILAIMQARTDIEADIALDLIKECDPNGERTIGVLTKLDLMNEGTDISHLLEGRVSRDLLLGYGYFGIRNRNKIEMESKTVSDAIKLEHDYFIKHPIYNNPKYKDNLGIPALCKCLSSTLIKYIKKSLPSILDKINRELESHTLEISKLGSSLPNDDNSRSSYIHSVFASFSRNYISILNDRGKIENTGRNIKQILIDYRNKLSDIHPFNKLHDSYFLDSIHNCEGNHMSFPSPPIEVLEQIMKDSNKRPIFSLLDISHEYNQKVNTELLDLIDHLLVEMNIERFPNLKKFIHSICVNDILIPLQSETYRQINNELASQENYIWTDRQEFIQELHKNNSMLPELEPINIVKNLCNSYFNSVVYILKDTIPKKIMFYLVKASQLELSSKLFEKLKQQDMCYLLMEYEHINLRRNNLEKNIKDLQLAKGLIDGLL